MTAAVKLVIYAKDVMPVILHQILVLDAIPAKDAILEMVQYVLQETLVLLDRIVEPANIVKAIIPAYLEIPQLV